LKYFRHTQYVTYSILNIRYLTMFDKERFLLGVNVWEIFFFTLPCVYLDLYTLNITKSFSHSLHLLTTSESITIVHL